MAKAAMVWIEPRRPADVENRANTGWERNNYPAVHVTLSPSA
jgi:hypothetical protein